jgi:hypothetical protein
MRPSPSGCPPRHVSIPVARSAPTRSTALYLPAARGPDTAAGPWDREISTFFWMYFPGESERIRWDRRGSAQVRALLARPWARIVQGRTPLTKGGSHCAGNFASRRSWRPCCWSSCWSRWRGCSSTEGGPQAGPPSSVSLKLAPAALLLLGRLPERNGWILPGSGSPKA